MKKTKLTDDEMDALVIADIDDESAWGEPASRFDGGQAFDFRLMPSRRRPQS